MHKGRVKPLDRHSGLVNAVLQHLHRPMRLLPLPQNARDLAYFVLNWPIFGMILRPSNNAKPTRTLTSRDSLMDICGVMCRQVVPNKNPVVVCFVHTELLYLRANVVAKIPKDVDCCPHTLDTPNPTPRTLNTPTDMRRKPRIPRLDCEENSDLRTVIVVPVFSNTKNLKRPPPSVVALLKSNAKFIDINQLSSGDFKNPERGRAVPEGPDTELDVLPLSLVGLC